MKHISLVVVQFVVHFKAEKVQEKSVKEIEIKEFKKEWSTIFGLNWKILPSSNGCELI